MMSFAMMREKGRSGLRGDAELDGSRAKWEILVKYLCARTATL